MKVSVTKLFTYDVVANPGFGSAKMVNPTNKYHDIDLAIKNIAKLTDGDIKKIISILIN